MNSVKINKKFLQTIMKMCEKEIILSENHLSSLSEDTRSTEIRDFIFDHISNCRELIDCIGDLALDPGYNDTIKIDQENIEFLTKRTKIFNKNKDLLAMFHISTDLH